MPNFKPLKEALVKGLDGLVSAEALKLKEFGLADFIFVNESEVNILVSAGLVRRLPIVSKNKRGVIYETNFSPMHVPSWQPPPYEITPKGRRVYEQIYGK